MVGWLIFKRLSFKVLNILLIRCPCPNNYRNKFVSIFVNTSSDVVFKKPFVTILRSFYKLLRAFTEAAVHRSGYSLIPH